MSIERYCQRKVSTARPGDTARSAAEQMDKDGVGCLVVVQGGKPVGVLTDLVGARAPAMSQQLALLRKDRLVTTRRDGQTIYYALARSDISKLMAFLYETYCGEDTAH